MKNPVSVIMFFSIGVSIPYRYSMKSDVVKGAGALLKFQSLIGIL